MQTPAEGARTDVWAPWGCWGMLRDAGSRVIYNNTASTNTSMYINYSVLSGVRVLDCWYQTPSLLAIPCRFHTDFWQ